MKLFLTFLLTIIAGLLNQAKEVTYNYSNIKTTEWIIPNANGLSFSFENYMGSKALVLKRGFDNFKTASIAYPKGLNFRNGIIELDLASTTGNDYLGIAFRIKDNSHYETLYFRPAGSGTISAIQYMPEKKNEFNWWDYESNKYQAKAILPSTSWFHIKAIINENKLTVFLNNQQKPVFTYNALDPSLRNGSVGFWLGNSTAGAFKNLIIKSL